MPLGKTVQGEVSCTPQDGPGSSFRTGRATLLSHLNELRLGITQIGDAGLIHLNDLTALKILWLDDTRVTDAGSKKLSKSIHLQELVHDHTQITDNCIKHLKAMTSLQSLYLINTKVTDVGVADLRIALPDCDIITYRG